MIVVHGMYCLFVPMHPLCTLLQPSCSERHGVPSSRWPPLRLSAMMETESSQPGGHGSQGIQSRTSSGEK